MQTRNTQTIKKKSHYKDGLVISGGMSLSQFIYPPKYCLLVEAGLDLGSVFAPWMSGFPLVSLRHGSKKRSRQSKTIRPRIPSCWRMKLHELNCECLIPFWMCSLVSWYPKRALFQKKSLAGWNQFSGTFLELERIGTEHGCSAWSFFLAETQPPPQKKKRKRKRKRHFHFQTAKQTISSFFFTVLNPPCKKSVWIRLWLKIAHQKHRLGSTIFHVISCSW